MVAALIGLAANSLIMFLAVHAVHWSPYVGLVWSVLLVPPLTFALNHLWVFRPRK
jgi:putative flippase GtrA